MPMARIFVHFGFSEEEAERRIGEFLFMSVSSAEILTLVDT